ncbi:MAG: Crp/Fnr family transcriptional regulator [Dissulfurispiraceae bacterium]|jgi:CRP/FNR family transcriptional regulator/CRP/FNR family cyclic AMP-dependent transcriptional regulator
MIKIENDDQLVENFLRDIPIFKGIPENDIKPIARNVKTFRYKKTETLFYQGDETMELYIVLNGRLRASLSDENGNEVTLATFSRGQFLGEMSLFDGSPRSATVTAVEDSQVGILKRESLLESIRQNPMIAIHILSTLIKRLRETDAMVESMAFCAVDERLIKLLMQIVKTEGESVGDGFYRIKKLTQKDLASRIGSSREAVSKAMQLLSRSKKVVEQQGYFIISPDN